MFMIMINIAFFLFSLFSIPATYHARHLPELQLTYSTKEISLKISLCPTEDSKQETSNMIKMVNDGGEVKTPTWSSSIGVDHLNLQLHGTGEEESYDEIINACKMSGTSTLGQVLCGREIPKAPPTPKPAPSQQQGTYNGRVSPSAPTPPKPAPSQQQGTYNGRVSPSAPAPPQPVPSPHYAIYGRGTPKAPPAPKSAPPGHQIIYGRTSSTPPPPKSATPDHQTIYTREPPKTPPAPKPEPSRGQAVDDKENPTAASKSGLLQGQAKSSAGVLLADI